MSDILANQLEENRRQQREAVDNELRVVIRAAFFDKGVTAEEMLFLLTRMLPELALFYMSPVPVAELDKLAPLELEAVWSKAFGFAQGHVAAAFTRAQKSVR